MLELVWPCACGQVPLKRHLRAQNLKQGRKEELSGCFWGLQRGFGAARRGAGGPLALLWWAQVLAHHASLADGGAELPGHHKMLAFASRWHFCALKYFFFVCACVSKPSTTSENSCPSHFAVEGADPQQLPRLVVLSPVLPARAAGAHSLFSHPCAVPRWLGCCSRASGGLGSGSPPPACEVLAGETFLEPPDCNPRGLVAENERRKRCLAPSNNSPTRVRAALSRH